MRAHAAEAAARGEPYAPEEDEALTVGAVAAMLDVSVRTLHHWDQIGLAGPGGRSLSGYRLYTAADIARLQQVLVHRELGLPLAEIAALLDDPTVDTRERLHHQRNLLCDRIQALEAMREGVDRMLQHHARGAVLSAREQAELFGPRWRTRWGDEAQERWGASEQWHQYEANAAGMSPAERDQLRRTGDDLYARMARAMRDGEEPQGARAQELVREHRQMLSRLFDCTVPMQVLIARVYVEDERFTAHLDGIQEGLAAWLHAAIRTSARAHGIDPDSARWE